MKQNAERMMTNPRTVLHRAISQGLVKVTKVLISRGASLERAMESTEDLDKFEEGMKNETMQAAIAYGKSLGE